MKFHVLTLFPEMIEQGLASSITGRALEEGKISLNAVNIRDYTQEKHGRVDDYPYGGGAGMLMQAQPVFDAYHAVTGGRRLRTVFVTPAGTVFNQKMAKELSGEEELVFLCGHYEGIDERVLEEVVTDCVSIGDYVLTGGELPAMVMIDAIARFVPGVLGNEESACEESFFNDLLEYPQYSRPENWHGMRVPAVLLSGNHRKIEEWRRQQAEERTKRVRPDLYVRYEEKQRLIKRLARDKRNQIHIMESLRRGLGEILYAEEGGLLVYDSGARVGMMIMPEHQGTDGSAADEKNRTAESSVTNEKSRTAGIKMLGQLPAEAEYVVTTQETLMRLLRENGFFVFLKCRQYLYPQRESLPVRHKDIRRLVRTEMTEAQTTFLYAHYDAEEIGERLDAGVLYGAFDGERLVGFIGLHAEGSEGLLYVDEQYRRRGIAESLEAYLVNRQLEKGWIPYTQVGEGNRASERLQEKLGFYPAGKRVWWMKKMLAISRSIC